MRLYLCICYNYLSYCNSFFRQAVLIVHVLYCKIYLSINPPTKWEVVLNRTVKDRLHEIIKRDDLIIQIGKDIYDSRKPAKEKDGKIKARIAMCRLAGQVEATKGVTKAEQVFVISNF